MKTAITEYFDQLSSNEMHKFIIAHEHDDAQKLLLKGGEKFGVPMKFIAQQITGRQKIKSKLPTWFNNLNILYPPSLNLEQCSSEITARFKQSFLLTLLSRGGTGVDLTGGFGVDAAFLKRHVERLYYVEKDQLLFQIAEQNFKTLGCIGIQTHPVSAEEFLNDSEERFSFIYIDPSRRKDSKKVFRLADCEPNVSALLEVLFSRSDLILIKASPLLDIQQGIQELKNVAEILVIAIDNECRELVFIIRKGFNDEPLIRAVNITGGKMDLNSMITFKKSEEIVAEVSFSSPEKFIYEPNAAILKAGAFRWVSQQFEVSKLAPNSHLYTGDSKIEFPGRTFKILDRLKLDKKIKDNFPDGYANILIRNYPLTVEEVKKKTGLKEGGDLYLICTQDQKEKIVLTAEKV